MQLLRLGGSPFGIALPTRRSASPRKVTTPFPSRTHAPASRASSWRSAELGGAFVCPSARSCAVESCPSSDLTHPARSEGRKLIHPIAWATSRARSALEDPDPPQPVAPINMAARTATLSLLGRANTGGRYLRSSAGAREAATSSESSATADSLASVELHPLAAQFASVADVYERGRPEYAPAAIGALAAELGLRPSDR